MFLDRALGLTYQTMLALPPARREHNLMTRLWRPRWVFRKQTHAHHSAMDQQHQGSLAQWRRLLTRLLDLVEFPRYCTSWGEHSGHQRVEGLQLQGLTCRRTHILPCRTIKLHLHLLQCLPLIKWQMQLSPPRRQSILQRHRDDDPLILPSACTLQLTCSASIHKLPPFYMHLS